MKKVTLSTHNLGAVIKMTTRVQVTVYITLLFILDSTSPMDYLDTIEEVTGFGTGTIKAALEMLTLDEHIFYEKNKIRIT